MGLTYQNKTVESGASMCLRRPAAPCWTSAPWQSMDFLGSVFETSPGIPHGTIPVSTTFSGFTSCRIPSIRISLPHTINCSHWMFSSSGKPVALLLGNIAAKWTIHKIIQALVFSSVGGGLKDRYWWNLDDLESNWLTSHQTSAEEDVQPEVGEAKEFTRQGDRENAKVLNHRFKSLVSHWWNKRPDFWNQNMGGICMNLPQFAEIRYSVSFSSNITLSGIEDAKN